ncbi:MAG: Ubiquinone/menaquinone biosynthesis C-methyltransferase UbiE [Steroidobacteraceae bacterium]|nr:Ubiquinone/menaquinone biosynthesis C-methyltransferase UbiE [Steroidobacteraceae bacterium]
MARNARHELLARTDHDEAARQAFVVALKQALNRTLRSTNEALYEATVEPDLRAGSRGAEPSREAIRDAMYAGSAYRSWCALNRGAQELMWDAVGSPIRRERARLEASARRLAGERAAGGSLELDPAFTPPRGITAMDIHLQPGGYALDLGEGDIMAGALYEAGGNLYAFGQGIGRTDSKAQHVQRFIAKRWPGFRPARILDMGCSAGSASVPYALEYPDAEVHAIDVGAGMLRYAHARAEALGAAVHFHQRDCTATGFADASFDLVVSHNLMHESSDATRRAMLRETWRMLAPGGVFVHQDVPLRFAGLSAFRKFELSWDTRNNNEPFWEVYANADLAADMAAAGIPADRTWVGHLPQTEGSLPWFAAAGSRPAG